MTALRNFSFSFPRFFWPRALATTFGVISMSAAGVVAGAAIAAFGSKLLDETGVFKYSPEDADDDGSNVADNQPCGSTAIVSNETLELARQRLAFESTGDLTLCATVNPQKFDSAARAFQLLQYRSYLVALDRNAPAPKSAFLLQEHNHTRKFIVESIAHLESEQKRLRTR